MIKLHPHAAFAIVGHIFETNVRGISPAVMAFYQDIIKPLQAEKVLAHDIECSEVRSRYRQIYSKPLDSNRYTQYITTCEHHGRIELCACKTVQFWRRIRIVTILHELRASCHNSLKFLRQY